MLVKLKAISFNGVITSIRGKVDKSIGLNIATPELAVDEKSMFFELQGENCNIFIAPTGESKTPDYKIDKVLESKTPSQRLRSVLFVYYEQAGIKGKFDSFYRQSLEKFIDQVKEKLE